MSICKNCKTEDPNPDFFCKTCNYPLKGTEQQQAKFGAQQIILKHKVKDSIKSLKTARVILFIIGSFYFLISFTPLVNSDDSLLIGLNIALGLVFLGFGFLTFKYPRIALAIPLVMILLFYFFSFLINPMSLFSGMLWKVVILTSLGFGYLRVSNANIILKKNKYLAQLLGLKKVY